jgi:hypothetical protein
MSEVLAVRRLIAALDRGLAAFLSIQGIQSGNGLPHSKELVGAPLECGD